MGELAAENVCEDYERAGEGNNSYYYFIGVFFEHFTSSINRSTSRIHPATCSRYDEHCYPIDIE
jgi:hypothetical protein